MPSSLVCDKISLLTKYFPIPNLKSLFQNLPFFCVQGSQLQILNGPDEFYDELLSKCSSAKQCIVMSSLYLGNGKLEKDLVQRIGKQMEAQPGLNVSFLLDFTRASRGVNNSRTMLLPLANQFPDKFKVSLYHTPTLRGLLKFLLPQRYNELVGLQHIKVYIFDNSLIISGANLSNDYFVNRQDRYILINNCQDLASFYKNLIGTIAKYSLQLDPQNNLSKSQSVSVHPYKGSYNEYCQQVSKAVTFLLESEIQKGHERLKQFVYDLETSKNPQDDTIVFPTLQMPHFYIYNDQKITQSILTSAGGDCQIHLASGYFNLTEEYIESIVNQSQAEFKVVSAHPTANGFLGAGGLAGGIPAAYTQLCKLFFNKIKTFRQDDRIKVSEFVKTGWTFHAKGLWFFPPAFKEPLYTMIGSPNFGYRSVKRDLESQLIIATTNSSLRRSLWEEQNRLFESSEVVREETFEMSSRRVPLWVKLVARFLRHFF